MTHKVTKINDFEMGQVSGGVTEGPDGKSCTEPRDKRPQPGLLQGGPGTISIDLMLGR